MALNLLFSFLRQDEEAVVAGWGVGSQTVKANRIFQGAGKSDVKLLVLMGLCV